MMFLKLEQIVMSLKVGLIFYSPMTYPRSYVLQYLYFSVICYCISLTLTKVSILLQYRRIFTIDKMQLPIYIVMTIVVAYGIEMVLTGTFSCVPVDAFWEVLKKPTAKCLDSNKYINSKNLTYTWNLD